MEPEEGAGHALDTAGRAVLFAGTTVVISVLGMLVMGLEFIRGIGIGSAITVVVDDARVDHAAAGAARLRQGPPRGHPPAGPHRRRARRRRPRRRSASASPLFLLARAAGRRRRARRLVPAGRSSAAAAPPPEAPARDVLVPLQPLRAAPLVARRHRRPARARCSSPCRCSASASASPTRATSPRTPTTRQAYDLLAEGFGPGFNGPLLARRRGARRHRRRRRWRRSPRRSPRTDGVAVAVGPTMSDDGDRRPLVRRVPTTAPQDGRDRGPRRTASRERRSPSRERRHRARRARHQLHRDEHRLLRLPRRPLRRSSSPSCSACRSCC